MHSETKQRLGWALRMLIAAVGIGYILYTLDWTDRVWLPPGYALVAEGVRGGDEGAALRVFEETESAYRIGLAPDRHGHGPDQAWIDKARFDSGEGSPRFEPSFITLVGNADRPRLLGGVVCFGLVFLVGALRWNILMRARGIEARYPQTLRLTMAGQFFNLCMPGSTGGDVMKAYYVSKSTHQRADAVVSVAVDRVCGLVGLILVVCIAGLFSLDDPLLRRLCLAMWVVLGCIVLGASLYASKSVRARLRLGGLIGRLPGAGALRKLDALVAAYRNHVGALLSGIGLSVLVHLGLSSAMILAGFALGVEQPLLYLLGTVPIVLMLWSLPVSGPLGLGPLDYVAVQIIVGSSETTAQQALVMFVAYRLYAVAVGLLGATTLFGGGLSSRVGTQELAGA